MDNKTSSKIYDVLNAYIKNPVTELVYSTNFELLIAVVLSAQCTDKRVNIVTKELFKKYNTPIMFSNIEQAELEQLIHSCGFYVNKSKSIIGLSQKIVQEFNGQVPSTFEKLITLPGVGRKTANVMLTVAFNVPAIPVDTHVFRVSTRLGLVNTSNVLDCEKQLMEVYAKIKPNWGKLHHLILLHGRYSCKAQNPVCESCILQEFCKYYKDKK